MKAPHRIAAVEGTAEQVAANRTLTFVGYDASTGESCYSDFGHEWNWAAYQRELAAPTNDDMMDSAGRDAMCMNLHQWVAR